MKIQTVHVLRYPYSRVGSGTGDRRGEAAGKIPPGLFISVGATLSPPVYWFLDSVCALGESKERGNQRWFVVFFSRTWL